MPYTKQARMAAHWLLIIGGINWGLVGLLNYNLVDAVVSAGSGIGRVVYSLVGISALYAVLNMGKAI